MMKIVFPLFPGSIYGQAIESRKNYIFNLYSFNCRLAIVSRCQHKTVFDFFEFWIVAMIFTNTDRVVQKQTKRFLQKRYNKHFDMCRFYYACFNHVVTCIHM